MLLLWIELSSLLQMTCCCLNGTRESLFCLQSRGTVSFLSGETDSVSTEDQIEASRPHCSVPPGCLLVKTVGSLEDGYQEQHATSHDLLLHNLGRVSGVLK